MGCTEPSCCSGTSETPNPPGAGVAIQMEGAAAVGYGIPVGEDQNGRSGEFGENLAQNYLRDGPKIKLDPLPEKGGDRVNPLGQVAQELAIVPPHRPSGRGPALDNGAWSFFFNQC